MITIICQVVVDNGKQARYVESAEKISATTTPAARQKVYAWFDDAFIAREDIKKIDNYFFAVVN